MKVVSISIAAKQKRQIGKILYSVMIARLSHLPSTIVHITNVRLAQATIPQLSKQLNLNNKKLITICQGIQKDIN